MADEEQEAALTPMDDTLDRDRRKFGLNLWVNIGCLMLAFVLFMLGNIFLKALAPLLGLGVPLGAARLTKRDPQRLVLAWVNLFLYSRYDSRKPATKGYLFRQWLRP